MTRNRDRGSDETEYLLRSKKNAERLLSALQEADRGGGEVMTIEELRKSLGLDEGSVRESGSQQREN
ncbi:MAG TPA: hypothetical protein VG225_01145 [Terracidiphilus sp.]|jgi:hypothetical protein|nr:hypothetical protein [Terracidiphilus sp.]